MSEIVAADTLGWEDEKAIPTRKVIPLGSSMLFAMTGAMRVGESNSTKNYYVATDVAKQAYRGLAKSPNTDSRTKAIIDRWTKIIQDDMADSHHSFYRQGDKIVTGFFFSNLSGKGWSIYETELWAGPQEPHGISQKVIDEPRVLVLYDGQTIEPGMEEGRILTTKFRQNQTPDAHSLHDKMHRAIKSLHITDTDAFNLEFQICAAEFWNPKAHFGGPVDVIELTPAGVHWIRQNDDCKKYQ
jgi:hypothetical protein